MERARTGPVARRSRTKGVEHVVANRIRSQKSNIGPSPPWWAKRLQHPLLREGCPIGGILQRRASEPVPFSSPASGAKLVRLTYPLVLYGGPGSTQRRLELSGRDAGHQQHTARDGIMYGVSP